MKTIDRLSSSTGRRSKETNKTFAKEIAARNDNTTIAELIDLLGDKDKNIQSDAIEVLYEAGYIKPELISDHARVFVSLLGNKNNRLVWGAMIALSSISSVIPKTIYKELPTIVNTINNGSVITKDAGVALLANLMSVASQKTVVLPVLLNELTICPPKQLPQYAEKTIIAIDETNKREFLKLLNRRVPEFEKDSQIKRIRKVLKKIENGLP